MKEKEKKASARIEATIGKIKDVVDVNTIIGEPREIAPGVTVMTVSKVTYGFASGGTDIPNKTKDEFFAGGGAAGVTLEPLAFLVVNGNDVRLLEVSTKYNGSLDKAITMAPDIIDKVKDAIGDLKGNK